jgi:uncharacterized protein YndB with AHSA1/START domain
MNDPSHPTSTRHDTFVIERRLDASPARVYAAFADQAAKRAWFAGSAGLTQLRNELDFRVGGEEHVDGRWTSGMVSKFHAVYHDIVPARRIVYSYDMHLDERKISVSLATIEFHPDGVGTRLKLTEQGAFLDGYDDAGARERGTNGLMDALEKSLARS